jgi:H+-translocating NAD(P) transhydrogenase subunit alpha
MALLIGVPKETAAGEKRVATVPEVVEKLIKLGFTVAVESGAGDAANCSDEAYTAAGAQVLPDAATLWAKSDIVFKVRPPSAEEVAGMREGGMLIGFVWPAQNPALMEQLAAKKATVLAIDALPRQLSRAQKMDALTSQAGVSGYRAVIEAANAFGRFFNGQITAAGKVPPAKVFIAGAGVAGLAAIGTAANLGAIVRANDTRAEVADQVVSLGGEFVKVDYEEEGSGGGGYAKVMSEGFQAAQREMYAKQAREVDIIITTALVPGTKAPLLVPRAVVEALRPGSIVVDLAAEQGGNCELTVPGQVAEHRGVKILGFTDWASRMAPTASRMFANNLVHLLDDMGGGKAFKVDVESDVVRPALLTHQGEVLPPPPKKEPTAALAPKPAPPKPKPSEQAPTAHPPPKIRDPVKRAWGTTVGSLVLLGTLFFLGRFAPGDFLQHFTVFILACFVGWQVIWAVTPALHTPLMSVTNAISGIIIIGGMLQIGSGVDVPTILGAAAVLIAAINVSGGFLVTRRMLKMFHREGQ